MAGLQSLTLVGMLVAKSRTKEPENPSRPFRFKGRETIMEIYLDAHKMDHPLADVDNLGDLLVDIMSGHIPSGRILSEVLVNGTTYNESFPNEVMGVNLNTISRLDLVTVPSTALAQVLINQGPDHLDVLAEAALKLADEFRLNDEAEANEKFLLFLQAMQDFFSFLGQALDILAISLAHLEMEGLSASDKLKELTRILTDMSNRQEEYDWILLADTMEYDLVPVLKDWKRILTRVKYVAQ